MKILSKILFSLGFISMISCLPLSSAAEDPAVLVRQDMTLVSVVAEVSAINYETREVTLKDELGKETSLIASEAIERLHKVSAGDLIKVDYYISIAYELRAPTAEELENPLQVEEIAAKAGMELDPGAGAISMIKAVCVIEGLDRPTETVTLMGPLGGLNVVKVEDVSNMPYLNIGQPVVVTFTQAMAISLEKVDSP